MSFGSGIRDPGSGINLFRIPDPGVKKAPNPGFGSATLYKMNKNTTAVISDEWGFFLETQISLADSNNAVWRIRDVYPGSRILIFTHPGSRISDPGTKNCNKRE
jgi:hypothetical protein